MTPGVHAQVWLQFTSCAKIRNKFQFFEVTLFTWRGKKQISKSLCNLCNLSTQTHMSISLHCFYIFCLLWFLPFRVAFLPQNQKNIVERKFVFFYISKKNSCWKMKIGKEWKENFKHPLLLSICLVRSVLDL